MRVILISGLAGHGKDTAGEFLSSRLIRDGHSVLVTHFADLLKYICKNFFGWNGLKDEAGRTLLQHVGTDVVREKDPDFWVRFMVQVLSMFPNRWEYVILPDTRFPNEITGMIDAGFDVVHLRIIRGATDTLTATQRLHPSERALADTEPDYFIDNTQGLPELRQTINQFVEDLYGNKA